MKINVEVDCTPEEARRFMGLPDLSPLHARYIEKMGDMMDGSVQPEMVEAMMKGWAPMGEAGMTFWRQLFEAGGKPGG
ncbi:conserved hypothetical protein [Sphingomonas sp. EC-HK361]|uniref:DUF6489 family protein n=1 Tax=Sphingomonas sp. EC-HK361 TaxID=2038397 RepID=UPI00125B3FE7|nr:DUF6489 family protein [Sphingomonas sp. EC-HK361]VVS97734.1 conserved hypothetical protein [Sphingomonas sp. EC-HK361]